MSEASNLSTKKNVIYTLGYGGRSFEEWITLLRRYSIRALIDVRSRPYSKQQKEFTCKNLKAHMQETEIAYFFLGEKLGGLSKSERSKKPPLDYHTVMQEDRFQAGLRELLAILDTYSPVCLMCCERKPEQCHRTHLDAEALIKQGFRVLHIDENGDLKSHEEILKRNLSNQPTFF